MGLDPQNPRSPGLGSGRYRCLVALVGCRPRSELHGSRATVDRRDRHNRVRDVAVKGDRCGTEIDRHPLRRQFGLGGRPPIGRVELGEVIGAGQSDPGLIV